MRCFIFFFGNSNITFVTYKKLDTMKRFENKLLFIVVIHTFILLFVLSEKNTNVNAEPFHLTKSARLNVSNETMKPFRGTAQWSLRRPDASVIESGEFQVECPALSAVWLPEQNFDSYDTFGVYYSYELLDESGAYVGGGSVLFCPPKHFAFADPHLTARIEGDEIVVTADAYARSVEIQAGADTLLEDNYFDMNAGERRVKILRGQVAEVSARSVYNIR